MSDNTDLKKIQESILAIEKRISRLEGLVTKQDSGPVFNKETTPDTEPEVVKTEGTFESKIGEYGMAWLSNVVLFFGILFLLQLLKSTDLYLLSAVFGYASIGGIYLLGRSMSRPNPFMSKQLVINGHILLYIVTLRLHFATDNPLIGSKTVGLILILALIGVFFYLAYKNRSEILGILLMLMLVTAGMFSNNTHVMLSLLVITSAISLFFLHRFGWRGTFFLSIVLVYFSFLLWFFNNPVVTQEVQAVSSLQFSYVYLILCALIYSLVAVLPLGKQIQEGQINGSIIINGLGFSLMLAIISGNFFHDNFYIITGVVSVVSIAFSALLQSKKMHRLSGALYGLYGFAMLSVTIVGIFNFPLAYLLLSVESLLVLSMALWYSSRFIVTMNLLLYSTLLFAYLLAQVHLGSISLVFAFIAIVSARIINWRKELLNIKTEWIRNAYLLFGFIMTLTGLYHLVSHSYIAFSWAIAAGGFFVVSLILKNVKYRWLAIGAMVCAVIYFFIHDFKEANTWYRIVALLVIAAISLGFSLYYARKKDEG